MKLRFVFNPKKTGHKDAWTASAEGLPRTGIGRTEAEAMDCLVKSNYVAFGIQEIVVDNPSAAVPMTAWTVDGAKVIVAAMEEQKRKAKEVIGV